MKIELEHLIIHPYLFVIYPIIIIFTNNIGELMGNSGVIWWPLLISSLFTLTLQSLLTYLIKCKYKAGLLTTLVLICFFSYGHIHNQIVKQYSIGNQKYFFSLWLLLFTSILLLTARIKNKQNLYSWTKFLNIMTALLLTISAINIGLYSINTVAPEKQVNQEGITEIPPKTIRAEPERVSNPDIYYIILDSYASDNVLKNIMKYDRDSLSTSLEHKGFYVAQNSHSNYASTAPSLASSLNMEYINHLTEVVGADSTDLSILSNMVADNKTARILEDRGYEIIKIGSWSAVTFKNSGDYLFNEFNIVLLQSTLLKPFSEQILSPFYREGILSAFDKLAEIPHSGNRPKFVFAHIICPHPPYVFGPNGEAVSLVKGTIGKIDAAKLYLDQVTFINSKVIDLLDKILSEYENPPTIIIQGDHGAGYTFSTSLSGFPEPDDRFIKAQMGILNAYLVPDKTKKLLYDNITPVNSFRVIFNGQFDSKIQLAPDASYFSTLVKRYKFTDVTERLNY